MLASTIRFIWAGLVRHPQTGAFLPSQRFLINKMIEPVPRDFVGQVIELGAGSGRLTVRLAARCPRARILACEINPGLGRDTRENLNRAGINGQVQVLTVPAQELLANLATRPDEKPLYIISALPLGNFGRKTVQALVRLISQILPDHGTFIQVQHFLVDRKRIQAVFLSVRTVPVLLNILPAFLYYASKATK